VGEKCPVILPKRLTYTLHLGIFYMRKATTWDRRLYFPSEGRRVEDFFALKIRRLRSGANPRTWVPNAYGHLHKPITIPQTEGYSIPTYGPPVTKTHKAVFIAHSSLLPYCPARMVKRRNGCSSTIPGVSSEIKK